MRPTYIAPFVRLGFGLLAFALLMSFLVQSGPGGLIDAAISVRTNRPVAEMVALALPMTLKSMVIGLAYALPLGLLLGIPAGLRPHSLLDRLLQGPAVILSAVPAFALALVSLLILAVNGRMMPIQGAAQVGLVLLLAAWLARAVRNGLAGARDDSARLPVGGAVMAVLGRILQQTANILVITMLVEVVARGSGGGIWGLITTGVFTRDYPVVYGALWAVITIPLIGHLAGDLLTAVAGGRRPAGKLSRSWLILGGLLIAVVLLLPVLGAGDPIAVDLKERLQPPGAGNLLGTDQLGRDLLARIGAGARTSLIIATAGTVIAAFGGAFLAGISVALGRWGTLITPRVAVPGMFAPLVAGVALSMVLKPSIFSLIMILGVTSIPAMAWAFRRLFDGPQKGVLAMLGLTVLTFAQILLVEVILSHTGIGVMPPTASLGNLLSENASYIRLAPYLFWGAMPAAAALAGLFLVGNALVDGSEEEA